MVAGPSPDPSAGASPPSTGPTPRRTTTGPTAAALHRAAAGGRPAELDDVPWTDTKRWLWLIGLLVPLLTPASALLVWLTGLELFWWFGPMFVFGIIPLIDVAVGLDHENPPDVAIAWLEQDRYYRWVTYLYLPLQYAGLGFACWVWTTEPVREALTGATLDMGWISKVGLAVTVGCVAGIGINTAHELGHKTEDVERWLGKVALAQTLYGHFSIEHNRGHHVRVATPEDPASSRLGESFYAFLPRTVVGSLRSAWHLESRRMRRRGLSPLDPRNDVVNAWLMSVALFGVLVALFGPSVLPWLAVQAVFGFSLLEVVNYLEHYGLRRQRVTATRYERVRPEHSWNSDNLVTNLFLYHLQRHSDHHANPTRRYQSLRSEDGAPQLPAGYATMIVVAVVPPLWRRVMDHRLVAHYAGDLDRANIHPPKRERVLARLAATAEQARETARRAERGAQEAARAQTPAPGAAPAPVPARAVPAGVALAERPPAGPGSMACPVCDYTYDPAVGAPREGIPAGTAWADVPDGWECPDCGVRDKDDFVPAGPAARPPSSGM
jgi:alkane 1-monooxygenase